MPPHERYFEPFLGSGAVLRAKTLACESVGCDLSPGAVEAVANELGRRSGCIVGNGGGHVAIVGHVDADRTISHGDGARAEPGAIAADGVWRRRPSVVLVVGDVLAFLERRHFCREDLVYCDPPYPLSVRSGRKIYEHEWDDVRHRRFLRCVLRLPCMVMVSSYWGAMYGEALRDWRAIRYRAFTRWGGEREEWCWMNFASPAELHDYSFLGDTFRKREVVRRRRARWLRRLLGLPPFELAALILALGARGDGGPPIIDRISRGCAMSPAMTYGRSVKTLRRW